MWGARWRVAVGSVAAVALLVGLVVTTPATASIVSGRGWAEASDPDGPTSTGGVAAYDATRHQLVYFGGYRCCSGPGYSNDTWVRDGVTNQWTKLDPANRPSSRYGHTMAYDSTRGLVVLYGGAGSNGVPKGDTWTWDGTNWAQAAPLTSPPALTGAAMADDPTNGRVVLFGGLGQAATSGSTWSWDGTTWTDISPVTGPIPRSGAALAGQGASLLLFGGLAADGSTTLGDTWTFAGGTWTQQNPASAPSARQGASATFGAAQGVTVLFGGDAYNYDSEGGLPHDDTWTWDGSTWTLLAPSSGPVGDPYYQIGPSGSTMAYDVDLGRPVMVASASGPINSDTGLIAQTWEFDDDVALAVPGYWLVASDGGVFSFGDAQFHGSAGALPLNRPVVGISSVPGGQGYWLVASDGGIFSYGDAQFYGSTGSNTLNQPVVGMAATPSGQGYWLVASDGGIFSYGDAQFYGSTGSITLNQPVVGMAATPSGQGYWLVASDGGIFSYGDAQFYGSTVPPAPFGPSGAPAVGMASSPSGQGYLVAQAFGPATAFGDATPAYGYFDGPFSDANVGIARTNLGGGYWLASASGVVVSVGNATDQGSLATPLNAPIVGIAAT